MNSSRFEIYITLTDLRDYELIVQAVSRVKNCSLSQAEEQVEQGARSILLKAAQAIIEPQDNRPA